MKDSGFPYTPIAGCKALRRFPAFFHSFAFTTGRYPDNILIKGYNLRVTEGACKTCHAELTYSILGVHRGRDISCTSCHFDVGHSAAPSSFTVTTTSETTINSPVEENHGTTER
jgi:cytochrome c nitrite reductase small subunit